MAGLRHWSSNEFCLALAESERAQRAGMSSEFCDLVMRLLDKDPGTRISWAELPEHTFWQAPLPLRAMPAEVHLAAFVAAQRPAAPAPATAPALADAHIQVLTFFFSVHRKLQQS